LFVFVFYFIKARFVAQDVAVLENDPCALEKKGKSIVFGLNVPTKRHRLAKWIQKQTNKQKNTAIISSMFSDHSVERLDINYRGKKKPTKNTNLWKLKYTHLNKPTDHGRNQNVHRNE